MAHRTEIETKRYFAEEKREKEGRKQLHRGNDCATGTKKK